MRRCLRPALLALTLAAGLTPLRAARADGALDAFAEAMVASLALYELLLPDVALELRDGEPGAAVSFPLAIEVFGSSAFNLTIAGAPQFSTLEDHWRLLGSVRGTIAPFDGLPDIVFTDLQWALMFEGGWSYHPDIAGPLAGAGLTFGLWETVGPVNFMPTLTLGWRRFFLDRGPVVDQVIVDVQFAWSPF